MRKTAKKLSGIYHNINFELLFLSGALVYLMFIDPYSEGHLQLCGFNLLGFENCPGCGLGKSISFIFRGDFASSWRSHPLGFAAVLLIIFRVIKLVKVNYQNKSYNSEVGYGKSNSHYAGNNR